VTSYAVSPGFPAGLTLDATTGRISGTPTAPAPTQAYTVTASNASGSTTFDLTFSVLNERVTEDRPDEKTGHQVHVMYVLPSDATVDEQLDQTGTIEASLSIMNEWLATQTGGSKLRFDTYDGGKLDVTYLQVPRTDAQMNVFPSSVRKELDEQLYLHGFNSLEKVYLVYYGGDGENCGRGAWPPSLPGHIAALYIGEASGCRTVPFAAGSEPPAFLEFLALHEALHVLGFVPECAPHHALSGHVSDSVQDVMYSSVAAGDVLGEPSTLDVNIDDYYGLSVPGCLDLSNSAFLDPLPASAEAPPGWPYVDLTDLGCGFPGPTPGPLGVDTQIMFVNKYLHEGTESTAQIFEVVETAPGTYERQHRTNVNYNDGEMLPDRFVLEVKENTVFVVLVNNNCLRTVRTAANPGRFVIE
jgi:Putative Ig domain